MTPRELEGIRALREKNYSYQFIADILGISMNTVKSTCRRKGFSAHGKRKTKEEKLQSKFCKYCFEPLPGGRANKEFCSDKCRRSWWARHKAKKIKVLVIKPTIQLDINDG